MRAALEDCTRLGAWRDASSLRGHPCSNGALLQLYSTALRRKMKRDGRSPHPPAPLERWVHVTGSAASLSPTAAAVRSSGSAHRGAAARQMKMLGSLVRVRAPIAARARSSSRGPRRRRTRDAALQRRCACLAAAPSEPCASQAAAAPGHGRLSLPALDSPLLLVLGAAGCAAAVRSRFLWGARPRHARSSWRARGVRRPSGAAACTLSSPPSASPPSQTAAGPEMKAVSKERPCCSSRTRCGCGCGRRHHQRSACR